MRQARMLTAAAVFAAAGIVSLLPFTPAHAQEGGGTTATATATSTQQAPAEQQQRPPLRTIDPSEYGLKNRFRLSIGGYEIGSTNSFTQALIDLSGVDTSGFAAKADILFFRPTRHEAHLGIFYVAPPNSDGDGAFIVSPEYRWRFAAKGQAYYGVNAGVGIPAGGGGETSFVAGSAIGYEFGGRTTLEFRYYRDTDEFDITAVMLGFRF